MRSSPVSPQRVTAPARWLLALTLLVSFSGPSALRAQQRSAPSETDVHSDLARRVLAAAGGIRPGEFVMLTGGPHTVPLMESVAAAILRAGGAFAMQLETDRTRRVYNMELPVRHVRANDSAQAVLYRGLYDRVAAFIFFPGSQDPDAIQGELQADTARLSALNAASARSQAQWDRMRNTSRARFVYVNYPPTKSAMARSGMDSASYTGMQLAALTADQAEMQRTARTLARLLEGGKTMRVTTPAGTDLRLRLVGRRAAIYAGALEPEQAGAKLAALRTVALPGGTMSVAPEESSAAGRVVLPRSRCPTEAIVNERFEFRAGKLTGYEADSGGTCVQNYLATSRGTADRFGLLSIGLNPAFRVVEAGLGYRPSAARGMLGIWIGNNVDEGGSNTATTGRWFMLTGATLEIDGVVVVRDGQLTVAATSMP